MVACVSGLDSQYISLISLSVWQIFQGNQSNRVSPSLVLTVIVLWLFLLQNHRHRPLLHPCCPSQQVRAFGRNYPRHCNVNDVGLFALGVVAEGSCFTCDRSLFDESGVVCKRNQNWCVIHRFVCISRILFVFMTCRWPDRFLSFEISKRAGRYDRCHTKSQTPSVDSANIRFEPSQVQNEKRKKIVNDTSISFVAAWILVESQSKQEIQRSLFPN